MKVAGYILGAVALAVIAAGIAYSVDARARAAIRKVLGLPCESCAAAGAGIDGPTIEQGPTGVAASLGAP